MRLMCDVLHVCRAAYYAWIAKDSPATTLRDEVLAVYIKEIHRRSRGTYGSPRVHAELRAEGHKIGRRRVARIMVALGPSGTPKKRFRGSTTDSEHKAPIALNLVARNFVAANSNLVWVTDITYLLTEEGWVYLAAIIDLHNWKIVGWSLVDDMRAELCLDALWMALRLRTFARGLIHHSDRGSQYASNVYRTTLDEEGIVPSMSRKGDCWDNAVAESFFGTLEQELIKQLTQPWKNAAEVHKALADYIHNFYNTSRRHSTKGKGSPAAFESAWAKAAA